MAEQELGRLVIKIIADIGDLKKGFKDAEKEIKSFSEQTAGNLKGAFTAIKSHWLEISAAIAAVVGAYKTLESSVSTLVNLGQETAQLQRATGLTAEEASTLIAVADQMGVSFDTLSTAITQITRRMGGLKGIEDMVVDASGKTVDVFEKFGIQIKNSDGTMRSATDVLNQMRGAIQEASSETQQMAIATQFFRGSAQEMLKFLLLTDEQFNTIAKDAKKYGIVLTTENVARVKEFVMVHRDLDDAIQGVKISIGTVLLPTLTDMTKAITTTISELRNFKEEWGIILDAITVALKTVAVGVMGFFSGITTILLGIMEINRELLGIINLITFGAIPGMEEALDRFAEKEKKVIESLVRQGEAINKLLFGGEKTPEITTPRKKTTTTGETELTKEQVTALDKLEKKYGELQIALEKLKNPQEADRMALEQFISETMKNVNVQKGHIEMMGKLRAVFSELQAAIGFKEQAERTVKALSSIDDEIVKLRDEFLSLVDPVKADAQSFDFMIAKMVEGIPVTDEVIDSIKRLREAYKILRDEQGKQAIDRAEITRIEVESTQKTQTDLTILETAYERGSVSVEEYYSKKRIILQESTEAAIAAIETERGKVMREWTDSKIKEAELLNLETRIRQIQQEAQRQGIQLDIEEINGIARLNAERIRSSDIVRRAAIDAVNARLEAQREGARGATLTPFGTGEDVSLIKRRQVLELASLRSRLGEEEVAWITSNRNRLNDSETMMEAQSELDNLRAAHSMQIDEQIAKNSREVIETQWGGLTRSLGESLRSFFSDTARGELKSFGDYFNSFLLSLADSFNNIFVKKIESLLNELISSLMETKTGGGGGGGGGGFLAGLISWIGSLFKGMQTGGTFIATRPTPLVVGEGGEHELVSIIPLSKLIPASALGPSGGMSILRPFQGFAGGGNILGIPDSETQAKTVIVKHETHNWYAQDLQTFREFARRNRSPILEIISEDADSPNSVMRSVLKRGGR